MTAASESPVVIIGVGNLHRGDDAAGLLAVRALAKRALPHVRVVERSGEATGLLEAWASARLAIVVDAVVTGAAGGTIHRVNLHDAPLPERRGASTHAFGLAQAVQLGRALGDLPPRLVLYGIEANRFVSGEPPSAAVQAAARKVAGQLHRGFITSLP